MTETEIQAAIETKNAELEATKAKIAAAQLDVSLRSWPTFLQLPWPEQQRIRELVPGRVAQLERAHFTKVKV
jgi:hypothetical protein